MTRKSFIVTGLILILIVGTYYKRHSTPTPTNELTTPAAIAMIKAQSQQDNHLSLRPSDIALQDTEMTNGALQKLQQQFKDAHYEEALKLALQQIKDQNLSLSYRNWVEQQLPAIRTSLGWVLVQQGHCDEAIPLFEEAHRQTPLREAAKGLGICYYKKKNYDRAEEHMAQYLNQNSADGAVKVLYADIMESTGRFDDALALLRSINESQLDAKTRSDLMVDDRLKSMQAKVQESTRQITARSEHFTVIYRADEHQSLGPWALDVLESALNEFSQNWGFVPPDHPIETTLYPNRNFRELVSYSPQWSNGLFDGRLRIPIKERFQPSIDASEVQRVLRHELVHALLSDMAGRRGIPSWFGEGLAQVLECSGGCPFNQFPMAPGGFLAAEALAGDFTRLDAVNARMAYLQSHFLVQLLNSPGTGLEPGNVRSTIEAIGPTTPLDSNTLVQSSGRNFQEIIHLASGYWQQKKPLPFP